MRIRLVIMLIVGVAQLLLAAPPPASTQREPWEWSAQERAAARRDPTKRLERLRSYESNQNKVPPLADVLDASKNPELFFSTELFENLVRFGFVMLPETYQYVVAERSSDLFRDHADWERFGVIVREYADVLRQEKSSADALDTDGVSKANAAKCAASARALRAARKEFGRERFDRMLYETARFKRTYSLDTDLDGVIRRAREREEQCQ